MRRVADSYLVDLLNALVIRAFFAGQTLISSSLKAVTFVTDGLRAWHISALLTPPSSKETRMSGWNQLE